MTFRRILSVLFFAAGISVAAAAGATVVAAAGAGAEFAPVQDAAWLFRDGVSQWQAIACAAEVVRLPLASQHMLRLDVNLPAPAAIEHEVNLADMGVDFLSYRVYVPSSAPYGIMGMVYLTDKDGVWFQALSDAPFEPGKWNRHTVDISPTSPDLKPIGHRAHWNGYFAHRMNTVGIKLVSAAEFRGSIHIDSIVGLARRMPHDPLKILNFDVNSTKIERFGKFEVTFELNREFVNPFDPDEIDIQAAFTTPSGRTMTVAGFYYQDFTNRLENDEEVTRPVGPACWKIRYAPVEVGTHTYTILIKTRDDTIATAARAFTATHSSNSGFVRVSETDRRYFEFDNGDFFYPIGHNFRSPTDDRCANLLRMPVPPDHGTFTYEKIFPKMAAAGENVAEVWMASWWLEIEWRPEWKGYRGLGDYNMANAWRLDRVISLARRQDIYVHLVLENHGKASTWCDQEWADSPYNEVAGGFLTSPEQFFSDRRAKEIYKQKLRYIVARWGYQTHVMAFELWSELDLTGSHGSRSFFRTPVVTQWHREMADYIKSIDPYRHLTLTHYSSDYRWINVEVSNLPQMDYIAFDAYRQGNDRRCIAELLKEASNFCRQWNKPHWITEYGGTPWGTTPPGLEAELHAGLWTGFMLPMGATPLLWWFDFIDRDNMYFHFKAFANYAEGEDKRDPRLNIASVSLSGKGALAGKIKAAALQSSTKAYCWIYDEEINTTMKPWKDSPEYDDTAARLFNLEPGYYEVEFWDTYKGIIIDSAVLQTANGALEIKLPPFRRDIALKVKATARYAGETSSP